MRTVDNATKVFFLSYSMIGYHLTGFCLLAPAVLYYGFGLETDPNLWWLAAVGAWIFGTVGRIVKQGGLGGE